MNNQIDVSSYGIFILSIDQFSSFLKEEKKNKSEKSFTTSLKGTKFISEIDTNRKLAANSTN